MPNLTAEEYFKQGVDYYENKQFQEALQCFQKCVELNPEFVKAWNNLGVVQSDLENNKEAEQSYEQALLLNREHVSAWYNLGNVQSDLGNNKEAEQSYEQALLLNPEYVKAWYGLGLVQSYLGNKKAAEQSYFCSRINTLWYFSRHSISVRSSLFGRTLYRLFRTKQRTAFHPHLQGIQNRLFDVFGSSQRKNG